MTKIKVTEKQAAILDNYNKNNMTIQKLAEIRFRGINAEDGDIEKLSLDEIAVALYGDGYEIITPFKPNVLVTDNRDNDVYKVDSIDNNGIYLKHAGSNAINFHGRMTGIYGRLELATKEDVNRFNFADKNRDLWELRTGDLLKYLDSYLTVSGFHLEGEELMIKFDSSDDNAYAERLEFIKTNFKIVCFYDDRKDN